MKLSLVLFKSLKLNKYKNGNFKLNIIYIYIYIYIYIIHIQHIYNKDLNMTFISFSQNYLYCRVLLSLILLFIHVYHTIIASGQLTIEKKSIRISLFIFIHFYHAFRICNS